MEIPEKIALVMVFSHATVLSIFLFQTTEVAFQSVGRGGYLGVLEIVKHVGQGNQQHASGSFQVTKHPSPFWSTGNLATVALLPSVNGIEKLVPLLLSMDGADLQEKSAQVSGCSGLGIPPAPTKTLSLDVHQTTLSDDLGPKLAQGFDQMGVPVNRGSLRSGTAFG